MTLVACVMGCLGPREGEDGGRCYPNGTCNAGLTCLSDLCVAAPGPDGGSDGGPVPDTGPADSGAPPDCGNGILDPGEQCDEGAANSDQLANSCRDTCVLPSCGDGVQDVGEVCDDGNQAAGDGCAGDCRSDETCGNGILDPGEECDDGPANSDTVAGACREICVLFFCGDDIVDPGETCDDGAANSDVIPGACPTNCQGTSPPPPGSGDVVGTALLIGEVNHSGISVQLTPGGFTTITDVAGAYAFAAIPVGIYSAQLSSTGFATAAVSNIIVVGAGAYVVPTVTLVRGTLVTTDVEAFLNATPDGQWFLLKSLFGTTRTVAPDGSALSEYGCSPIVAASPPLVLNRAPFYPARPDSGGFWCVHDSILGGGLRYLDPMSAAEAFVDPAGFGIVGPAADPARVVYLTPGSSGLFQDAWTVSVGTAPALLLAGSGNIQLGGGLVVGYDPSAGLSWIADDGTGSVVGVTGVSFGVPAPDGSRVAYGAWTPALTAALYVALADGSSTTLLWDSGDTSSNNIYMRFASGSSVVVFSKPGWPLQSVAAVGGAPTTLLAGGVPSANWRVVQGGSGVVALIPASLDSDVYYGSPSGPLVLQGTVGIWSPTWVHEHPDGTRLILYDEETDNGGGFGVLDTATGVLFEVGATYSCQGDPLTSATACEAAGVLYALDISTGTFTAVDFAPLGFNVPQGFVYVKGGDLYLYTP